MAKKTTADVVDRWNQVHSHRFNYVLADYTGWNQNVLIGCKDCGRLFEQRADNHRRGHGCPVCQHNPFVPAVLYLIKMSHDDVGQPWLKIGVARKEHLTKRWRNHSDLDIEIIKTWQFHHKKNAVEIEQQVLKKLKAHRTPPGVEFPGKTECFPITLARELFETVRKAANDFKIL